MITALAALLAVACGGSEPGDAPAPASPPPDLTGARIMLLPARAPAPARLDAELAFWLGDRAPAADWVLPAELQRAADRAPAWRLRLDALPRPVRTLGGGDRRVADPLYGALRQLGAVVDANLAVVPVTAGVATDSLGTAVSLTTAVVDIRGGRVLWMHTVTGRARETLGAAVASAAETVARTLIP